MEDTSSYPETGRKNSMKIDLDELATTIRKLQELYKLAADPHVAHFITLNPARKNGATTDKGSKPYDSEFGTDVTNLLPSFNGKNFTVADVYEMLKQSSYKFLGEEPKKSIGNVLRALAADDHISVVQQGRGRRPSIYKTI
jgi:hypothetical protein